MKEAAEGAGRHNKREVRAAPLVVGGVARMKADMAKATSADHTRLVEVMEEEEQQAADTDNSLEATQADTTHRTRAVAASVSKVKVGIISKVKVADTVNPRKATTPMDSKADMIPSLALKDQMRGRHGFFSRYPGYFVVAASRRGRSLIRSSRKVSKPNSIDGVLGQIFPGYG